MHRLTSLALAAALAAPGVAAAQDGQHHVVRIDETSLVTLTIIDPVMGHGVVNTFYPEPRAVDGQQGVAFQTGYLIAGCDARTFRIGPQTYYDAQGAKLSQVQGNRTAAVVQPGTLEADLVDVECLERSSNLKLPPMSNAEVLRQYLEFLATRP